MSTLRDCATFLRRLADHIAAAKAGLTPEHASRCPTCAARLRLAIRLGEHIAAPPAGPAQLREPRFLEEIHEQLVREAEDTPLARALRPHLEHVSVPDSLPWPGQDIDRSTIQRHVVEPTSSPPSWLWIRVRAQVLRERAAQARRYRLRRRALWISAAAALLLAVVGLDLSTHYGTRRQPEIVFVTVTEMPSLLHPAAVLRQGGGR